jgi:hypothetical protein
MRGAELSEDDGRIPSRDLCDGSLLRVSGLDTKNVVGMHRDRDKLVLLATARERTPPPSSAAQHDHESISAPAGEWVS